MKFRFPPQRAQCSICDVHASPILLPQEALMVPVGSSATASTQEKELVSRRSSLVCSSTGDGSACRSFSRSILEPGCLSSRVSFCLEFKAYVKSLKDISCGVPPLGSGTWYSPRRLTHPTPCESACQSVWSSCPAVRVLGSAWE